MLNEVEIREALAAMDKALGNRGVRGEICLFGGAVMVLAYPAWQSTKDVDAVFAPTGPIRELVAQLAVEHGWDENWMNDGVKRWFSSRQDVADAGLNFEHLSVLVPSPYYLLAMKCMAARGERESRDMDDVKFLVRETGMKTPSDVLKLVEEYYPPSRITVKTQYFVEAAFEDIPA